jgi:hypothetical protein
MAGHARRHRPARVAKPAGRLRLAMHRRGCVTSLKRWCWKNTGAAVFFTRLGRLPGWRQAGCSAPRRGRNSTRSSKHMRRSGRIQPLTWSRTGATCIVSASDAFAGHRRRRPAELPGADGRYWDTAELFDQTVIPNSMHAEFVHPRAPEALSRITNTRAGSCLIAASALPRHAFAPSGLTASLA